MYYITFPDELMAKMFVKIIGGTRHGKNVQIEAFPGMLDYAQAYNATRITRVEAGDNGSKQP